MAIVGFGLPRRHLPQPDDLREEIGPFGGIFVGHQSHRPDLQQAKLDLERNGIQIKFDKNQIFPDLELAGGYSFTGSRTATFGANGLVGGQFSDVINKDWSTGDRPSYNYGASISFPLSNLAARNQRKADKAAQAQLELTFN